MSRAGCDEWPSWFGCFSYCLALRTIRVRRHAAQDPGSWCSLRHILLLGPLVVTYSTQLGYLEVGLAGRPIDGFVACKQFKNYPAAIGYHDFYPNCNFIFFFFPFLYTRESFWSSLAFISCLNIYLLFCCLNVHLRLSFLSFIVKVVVYVLYFWGLFCLPPFASKEFSLSFCRFTFHTYSSLVMFLCHFHQYFTYIVATTVNAHKTLVWCFGLIRR